MAVDVMTGKPAAAGRNLVDLDFRDSSQLLGFISHARRSFRDDANWFLRQSEINIAWYRGEQLRLWNHRTGRLETQDNPNRRERLVFNFTKTLVDSFVAKLGNDRIVLEVDPATDDVADASVARIQNAVLRYYHDQLHLDHVVSQADLWAAITGEAWVRVWWDPDAGEKLVDLEEDLRLSQEDLKELFGDRFEDLEDSVLHSGDLAVTLVPVFQIVYGPSDAQELDQIDWLIETQEISVDQAVDVYGLKPSEIKAIPAGSEARTYGLPGQSMRTLHNEVVKVHHLWVRRSRRIKNLKDGRYVVVVGDKVVHNGPNPYRHGKIPYVRMKFMESPSNYRGETWVTDLIAPQHDLNRAFSQFSEIRNRMAVPRWIAPAGSITDPRDWTNAAGVIAFYQGGRPPEQVPGGQIGASYFALVDRIMQLMRDISGIREISQARNPAGVRSGTMLSLLRESDDERMVPVARRRRIFWQEVGRLMLQTLRQFVTEQRVIRIVGDERSPETFRFTGNDLAGNNPGVQYFDVRVRTTGLVGSRSVRMEQLRQLLETGALNPQNPEHARVIFDMVELGISSRDLDPEGRWRRLQERRNQMMSQGEFEPPQPYENHQALQSELNNFRASVFYQNLDDSRKQLFDQYDKMLLAAMVVRQQQVQLIAQQVVGASPQPAQAALTQGPPAG